ncbi:pantetheine-phosphate adenylyltransferase [Halobacteriovorax marinus]|uniref:Phosphopantetheine adenylyltransferase n=1 Tax=Halobacteriovorax marinus (strain ATCC BAA-682 / DSM 15412 / SJ) TaxID=862908 RepID=E1X687_HALMS|nr:pantetheine-phosphate adenylyltransferase [Halobacteriovorax marinus]ATH08735.1 pantetheine-phosphate adenylyltransferase [Halobacteriovorax marinus]CBW27432.1 phosphopantetheine adenylyltransferase [Halobacteriovorax marinus SJ]
MKKKAVYAGTFDPFTNGHDDILKRALNLFDEVTVLVAVSPSKTPLFSAEQRVKMLEEHFKDDTQVRVDSWSGLLVDYAKKNNINTIIRGLRPTGDFEVEFQMASMNNKLYPEIETVFLMTEGQNYYISSSLIKEIYKHDGDVSEFVPAVINKWLVKA